MKVIPLLIFWALSFLPSGERGQSLAGCDARTAEIQGIFAVIEQARGESSSGDPASKGLSGSLWDDEDTLDDVAVDPGHDLSRSSSIRGQDKLTAVSLGQHDFLRTPAHAYPFRC
jgi:hypothetical protein